MSRVEEFVGGRVIEIADYHGNGNNLYSQWLTQESIVRCRDCAKSREKGWKCTRFAEEVYDEEHEVGELMMANVRPDGHCAWGERHE